MRGSEAPGGRAEGRKGCRQSIVPVVARDLFDEVDLAQHVDAKRRRCDVPARVRPADLEAESLENPLDVGLWNLEPEHPADARMAQLDVSRRDRRGIRVDGAATRGSRANFLEERDRALDAFERRVDVRAALEARGRFCLEPQLLAGPADALGIEERAFEHDGLRRAAHFGKAATHDAGHGLRFIGVGDDQHLRIEGTIDAVERLDAFAFHRAADADLSAGQLLQIEGVHRLAELEQHVVGDVHHVVDGPHAGGLQPWRRARRARARS